MGWEKGERYYTRSYRVDGRIVREYVGSGALGQLEAERDERRRRAEAAARHEWRQEQDLIRGLEQPVEELDTLCRLLMRATFESAGYHQHDRGEWRKRRG